jgi:chaperonin cofactor prefoldin
MFIGELYSDEELKLEAKISKVKELIDTCNSEITETERVIKELAKTYDDNKIMLQVLDKKADGLTRDYFYLNVQLQKLLRKANEE